MILGIGSTSIIAWAAWVTKKVMEKDGCFQRIEQKIDLLRDELKEYYKRKP